MPGYFPGYYLPLDESKDHHSADCEADLSAMFDIASTLNIYTRKQLLQFSFND